MFRTTTPYLNKHIRRREEQRNRNFHLQHLKQIRPSTGALGVPEEPQGHILNNRKREQLMENRFTEIERQNRILLEKITGIMGQRPKHRKRGASMFVNAKQGKELPKSLNVTFRKKQYQQIEIENAKLLKRLQEKRSDYQVDKMKKEWKRQRYVIRNISNYPPLEKKRRERSSEPGLHQRLKPTHPSEANMEINRVKSITGHSFVVNIKLDANKLTITAVQQNKQQSKSEPKVIQIPRDEAIEFISEECNNRIESLFEMLYFDGDTLFLIGQAQEEEEEDKPAEQRDHRQEQSHSKNIEAQAPQRIAVQQQRHTPFGKLALESQQQRPEEASPPRQSEPQQQKQTIGNQIHGQQEKNNHQEEPEPYQQDNFGESLDEVPIGQPISMDRQPQEPAPKMEQASH